MNVVRKATLGEISFVDLGADGQTSAQVAAAALHLSQEKIQMEDTALTTQATVTAQATDAPPAPTTVSQGVTPPVQAADAGPTVADSYRHGCLINSTVSWDSQQTTPFSERLR